MTGTAQAKAISFTPEILRLKLAALAKYGTAQTRRPIPDGWWRCTEPDDFGPDGELAAAEYCPFGKPGSLLWVRERARILAFSAAMESVRLRYEVDGAESDFVPFPDRLTNPGVGRCIANGVHREGARHFWRVTEVRMQRACDISEADALAEGFEASIDQFDGHYTLTARELFRAVFDGLYGPDAWEQWVWAISFEVRHG